MTKKIDKEAFKNAIKVLVTPWEKGFTCGIVMDSTTKLTTEEYELCSTIARGMIKMATTDPHSTFLWGLRGFADDNWKITDSFNPIFDNHALKSGTVFLRCDHSFPGVRRDKDTATFL